MAEEATSGISAGDWKLCLRGRVAICLNREFVLEHALMHRVIHDDVIQMFARLLIANGDEGL